MLIDFLFLFNINKSLKSQNFQKICQLYAKTGLTKNRTSLLSESSVFIVRSVALIMPRLTPVHDPVGGEAFNK